MNNLTVPPRILRRTSADPANTPPVEIEDGDIKFFWQVGAGTPTTIILESVPSHPLSWVGRIKGFSERHRYDMLFLDRDGRKYRLDRGVYQLGYRDGGRQYVMVNGRGSIAVASQREVDAAITGGWLTAP